VTFTPPKPLQHYFALMSYIKNSTLITTKCITNLMCISNIDAYMYQHLKEKTHTSPPYQSVTPIQTWWYSPFTKGFATYFNLMRDTLKPNCVQKEA